MCRLLCSLLIVCVLHFAQGFILDNAQCPLGCSCSEMTVYCAANTQQEWPVALQDADILRHLNLADNPHLGNIPRGAFDSFQHSLTDLNLDNTGLTQVPHDVKNLHILKVLYMSNNAIGDRNFPDDAFGNGPMSMYSLFLQNTSLTKIPLALCSLSNLYSLFLGRNDIKLISEKQAHCISSVAVLNLEDCGMSKIPSSLHLITTLTNLYLDRNPLRSIEQFDLFGLTYLRNLFLDHTSISYISRGAFTSTPSLQELHLDVNAITEIPEAFEVFNRSMTIVLTGNPVHCSCDMIWESDWMQKSEVTVTGSCENHGVTIDTYIRTQLPRCSS